MNIIIEIIGIGLLVYVGFQLGRVINFQKQIIILDNNITALMERRLESDKNLINVLDEVMK